MNITICIPFKGAEQLVPIWAEMERDIDFRKDADNAARTTMSFAATELKRCLEKAYPDVKCHFSDQWGKGYRINLEIEEYLSRNGSFSIIPDTDRLTVCGKGRAGLIYGVYELLYMQGYNWYYPGEDGEVYSGKAKSPVFPKKRMDKTPSMEVCRAFDLVNVSMESEDFFKWMARNRMNVGTWRPATGPLCEKLGMTFKMEKHMFEEMLDPNRPTPSGKTLWEEHEDWYGLPADGKRTKENAQKIQFCVSNSALIDFLCDELIDKLMNEHLHTDRIGIWGFDTWGSSCCCDACEKLGNGSDVTIHLISVLRDKFDYAVAEGRLNREVALSMCSYEGTATLEAPMNPLPDNVSRGVVNVYYPIDRCYAHPLAGCLRNARFDENMRNWLNTPGAPPFIFGEYYNVKKYEDLPLVLADKISKDIPYYKSLGVDGMTYMHVPMVNWGVRALTQCLYARLMYDVDTDVPAFLERYFKDMYGPAAELMKKYYKECEESMKYVASWRAWGDSILAQLLRWDGGKPDKLLVPDSHFNHINEMLAEARQLQNRLVEAGKTLFEAEKLCRSAHMPPLPFDSFNPVVEAKLRKSDPTFSRVCEVVRGHIYAEDVFALMLSTAEYHTALYEGKDTLKLWECVDGLTQKLEKYYVPISYERPGAGLLSRSADERSQLDVVTARIRLARSKG